MGQLLEFVSRRTLVPRMRKMLENVDIVNLN